MKAAPPGKIFSIFTMGCTLDSMPPEMLMPSEREALDELATSPLSPEETQDPDSRSCPDFSLILYSHLHNQDLPKHAPIPTSFLKPKPPRYTPKPTPRASPTPRAPPAGPVPPRLTQGRLHLGQRDCPQLPMRGLHGCLLSRPTSFILSGARMVSCLGRLPVQRSRQRWPGPPRLVVAPIGHTLGGDRCRRRGAPAPWGLAPAPAAAAAAALRTAMALALALPRVLQGRGLCQQPIRPWGSGSHRGWLRRGGAGALVWGKRIHRHILEREDPFMRLTGGRGAQGELEAPQPLPQPRIIFFLREAVHRQQIEASTAVWGRGPGSAGCPSSPLTRPQPLPLLVRGLGDTGMGLPGAPWHLPTVRDAAWVLLG